MPMNWPSCCIRRAERVLAIALLLLAGLGLSGCQTARQPANLKARSLADGVEAVLYLYIGVRDNSVDIEERRRDFNKTFETLEQEFRQVNPRTHFVVQLYPEDSLLRELAHRNASGLGPDLLLVSNRTALRLAKAGLTQPPKDVGDMLQKLDPSIVQRASLRNPPRLAGVPIAQSAQLACFNTARLPRVPTTVDELLAISAGGHPVGLSLNPAALYWSAGALGANEALLQAGLHRPLTAQQQQAVLTWTTWLWEAATQQNVTFYGNQELLLRALENGQVDWISCPSTDLQRLQRVLGARLGVAPLPDGPVHTASPINELTVLALGVNSSGRQRKAAEAFARFAINPLVQRTLTVNMREVLPVNRHVSVPSESSMVLKAMLRAQQQSKQADAMAALFHLQNRQLGHTESVITKLVFGESTPEATARQLIQDLQNQP